MRGNTKETVVRSVSRALEILEFIIQSNETPSFTKIQRATNIPKSSLSNLLRELVNNHYIQYNKQQKGYCPGVRFVSVSLRGLRKSVTYTAVREYVQQLSEQMKETAYAVDRTEDKAVYFVQRAVPGKVAMERITHEGDDSYAVIRRSAAYGVILHRLHDTKSIICIEAPIVDFSEGIVLMVGVCIYAKHYSFLELLHLVRNIKQIAGTICREFA